MNPENPTNSSIREKYVSQIDSEGYLSIGSFSTQELKRQSKNIASLLDGDEGASPEYNLGRGLRYTGSSGNYSDMRIHIDDLEDFIQRVREHYSH